MVTDLAVYGFYSKPRVVEPAGISYEVSRLLDCILLGKSTLPVLKISPDELNRLKTQSEDDVVEDVDWMDKENDKYFKYVSRLEPNDSKDQDHYRVLGLSKLRYKATMAQLKTACKFFSYKS